MTPHFIAHVRPSGQDAAGDSHQVPPPESSQPVVVGDVVVRRDGSGFGIFNYRGERVLDRTLRTTSEAEQIAAEIVSPWQGRVRVDTGTR